MASYVIVGPIAVFFTNRNRTMGLQAHSHTAEVTVWFADSAPPAPGWPSFENTNRWLADRLRAVLDRPVAGTNEDVARLLWNVAADAVDAEDTPANNYAGCQFHLHALELAVRGVPDAIGHDDGFTRYRIETPPLGVVDYR